MPETGLRPQLAPWSVDTATVADAAVSYTMAQVPSGAMATSQSPLNGWLGCGSTRLNEAPASVETQSGLGCVKQPCEHARMVWPSALASTEDSASPPGPSRMERASGKPRTVAGAAGGEGVLDAGAAQPAATARTKTTAAALPTFTSPSARRRFKWRAPPRPGR